MLVLFVFVLLFGAISHEVAAHLLTITYIPISFCGAYTIHRIYHHKNKRTSAFAIVIFYLIIFVTIGFIFNKSILGLLDIKQANIIVTLFSSNKLFLSLLLSYNLAIIASLLFYSRDKIVTAICILLIASSLFYYASTTLALCEIFVLQ
jgi:hypothetical protein